MPSWRLIFTNSIAFRCFEMFDPVTVFLAFAGELQHSNARKLLQTQEGLGAPTAALRQGQWHSGAVAPSTQLAPWYQLATILGWYSDAMFLLHHGAAVPQHQGAKSISCREAIKIEF